jgi:hypothetical protein
MQSPNDGRGIEYLGRVPAQKRWDDAAVLRALCSVSDQVSVAAQYVAKGRLLA